MEAVWFCYFNEGWKNVRIVCPGEGRTFSPFQKFTHVLYPVQAHIQREPASFVASSIVWFKKACSSVNCFSQKPSWRCVFNLSQELLFVSTQFLCKSSCQVLRAFTVIEGYTVSSMWRTRMFYTCAIFVVARVYPTKLEIVTEPVNHKLKREKKRNSKWQVAFYPFTQFFL